MRIHRLLPIAAAVIVAGCASDSTSPTVDVEAIVDQMTGGGIGAYGSAGLGSSVPGASGVVSVPSSGSSSCAYNAASQMFVCTPIVANGLTLSRSYQLLNASGQAMSVLDPAALAAIRAITDVEGTVTQSGSTIGSMTIDRHEDATMTGLRTTSHVLNGTATQKLDFSMDGGSFSSNETSATSNLQLPQPNATPKWPLGGSITTDRTLTVSQTGSPTVSLTSHDVLSFDGSSVVTISSTMSGVTRVCKIDMAKPGTITCN